MKTPPILIVIFFLPGTLLVMVMIAINHGVNNMINDDLLIYQYGNKFGVEIGFFSVAFWIWIAHLLI